jgi:hypothetical protein
MKFKRHTLFWIITTLVFSALLLPGLLQDGMFMDGIQYACVAKNLANGSGSFWFPFLSETWWKAGSPYFMEHPPLVYSLQAAFFYLFGDSFLVERMYSLMMTLVSTFFIVKIWTTLAATKEQLKLGWLPVLLWIIVPLTFWSFQNNILENTLGVFTSGAIYFACLGVKRGRSRIIWIILSGAFIFLATFSKGVPGLFPIAFFGIYFSLHQNYKLREALTDTIIVIAIPGLIYFALSFFDSASESLTFYVKDRLLSRIGNEPTVGNRFYSLGKLPMELVPPIILSLALFILAKAKGQNIKPSVSQKKSALLFIGIGLSASLPLMLTPVQRGFYMLPSFQYFALGFSFLLAQSVTNLIQRIDVSGRSYRVLTLIGSLLLLSTLIYSSLQAGKPGRSKRTLHDVYVIGNQLAEGSVVGVSDEVYNNWEFQFYMLRYFNISFQPSPTITTSIFISSNKNQELKNYIPLPYSTKKFYVFEFDSNSGEMRMPE